MKSIEELKSKYAERAVNRAGCWLLDVNAALDFLADLEANKIAVNGIEGYWLRGNAIEPSLANSVYFIGTDIRVASLKGSDSFAKARTFLLQRQSTGLLFDFDTGAG